MRNIGLALAAAFALSFPAAAKSTARAEVQCADGTSSKAGRGACSHHGGVLKAQVEPSTGAPTQAKQRARNQSREPEEGTRAQNSGGALGRIFGRSNKAETPRSSSRDEKSGSPTARCKDGTLSYSAHHTGTCSRHGGVQEWLDR